MEQVQKLKQLQIRVKQLATNRDQLLRDLGTEESKLNQAYAKLRELGAEKPEQLSTKELQDLAAQYEVELNEKIKLIEAHITDGENLMQSYMELQEA